MASVRFTDVQARPTEFLDLTSVTLDEFQQLVPPFGGVAPRRATPDRAPVYRVPELPPADTRGSVIVYSRLCQDLFAPCGPGAPVQHGAEGLDHRVGHFRPLIITA